MRTTNPLPRELDWMSEIEILEEGMLPFISLPVRQHNGSNLLSIPYDVRSSSSLENTRHGVMY